MKLNIAFLITISLALFDSAMHAQTIVNITATDASAAETWPGQTPNPGNVRVTRTGSTSSALTVWLKLSGSAVRGLDYTFGSAAGTAVTIPAGSDELDVPIHVLDDAVTESVETLRVDLDDNTGTGAPVSYTIGKEDRATVSIEDNDDPNLPPRVLVSIAALYDASEGTNGAPISGAFRITRTANLNVPVTVSYSVGGSATPDVDYIALAGSVVIPEGMGFADVQVTPLDDELLENPESIQLTLLPSACPGIFPPPPECYSIGSPASAIMTVFDNEIPPPPPTVTLRLQQDTNVFGFPAKVNGSFSSTSSNGFIKSYVVNVDGVTKFSGTTDYPETPLPGTSFEFNFVTSHPTGGMHQFQVTAVDSIGLATTIQRAFFISAIQPPRPPPATYSIVALDAEASETTADETPNPGRFLFTRTGTPGDLELAFYSFTGSAREGVDYTISFGAWNSTTNGVTNIVTQEITIHPIDDDLLEGREAVKMQLCFPIIVMIYGVGAPIGTSCTGDTPGLNATIELMDNDVTPPPFAVVSVTASDPDAREVSPLSSDPPNPGAFTLTRTAPATNELTVNYSLSQSAATANPSVDHIAVNGLDYERLSGVAIIPAGSLSTTIPLNPIFDTWLEGNETATLTLLPATNSSSHYLLDTGAINTATVTIRDFAPTNIPIVSIKAIDAQAYEQNVSSRTGTFLITRHGGVAGDLTLNYSISGEASNGVDYVALPGFVTLQASNSTATITIDPIADAIAEPVETVAITIPPAPIDIFPPPYLLGTALTLYNSAGVIIRDQLPPLDGLSRRQRIVWLRRHHHVIVPLPVVSAPAPTTNEVAVTWSVEASSDLTAWQEIGTAEDPDEFVDVDAGDAPKRFYRFRNLAPIQR